MQKDTRDVVPSLSTSSLGVTERSYVGGWMRGLGGPDLQHADGHYDGQRGGRSRLTFVVGSLTETMVG